MLAIAWVMFQFTFISPQIPVVLAGIFTLISWAGYMLDGIRQLHHSAHAQPTVLPPPPSAQINGTSLEELEKRP